MQRSTGGSKWVAADGRRAATAQQAGSSKTVPSMSQSNHCTNTMFSASVYSHDGRLDMDAREEDVSPRTQASFPRKVRPATVSPNAHSQEPRQDSLGSPVELRDFSRSEKVRKASEVTVFPHFPAEIHKSEPEPESSWWKQGLSSTSEHVANVRTPIKPKVRRPHEKPADWFQTAKDIYKTGPQGEGQKVWNAYQESRKVKQTVIKPKHNTPNPHTRTNPPLRRHSLHTTQPPLRPLPLPSHSSNPILDPQHPRQPSNFSQTSYEVPISIDHSIRPHRTVDTSKPLPPVPRLAAAPKPRRQGGGDVTLGSPPQPPWSVGYVSANTRANRGLSEMSRADSRAEGSWWKAMRERMGEGRSGDGKKAVSGSVRSADSKRERCEGGGGLKAKISRPLAVGVERGGRDRQRRPTTLPLAEGRVGCGAGVGGKGKQRADGDGNGDVQHRMDRVENSALDGRMVPEPLFSGKREKGSRSGDRDTGWYAPYYDVLKEYGE